MHRREVLIGGGALGAAAVVGGAAAYRSSVSLDDYEAAIARTRAELRRDPGAADLIRYATLAANGHNTQPWRFRVTREGIAVLPDFSRRTPVVDPDDHHLFVSLGCAAENLAIAAASRGRSGEVSFNTQDGGTILVGTGVGRGAHGELAAAIPSGSRRAPNMMVALFPLQNCRPSRLPPPCRESRPSLSSTALA